MRSVRFFFGIGSRYSYLAATQIPALAAETGARFEWSPLYSRELIAATGNDPFRPDVLRGQYDAAYRTRDAARWASYYGVPYKEPDWSAADWKLLALACVAAGQMGKVELFAQRLFKACFGTGEAPRDIDALQDLAEEVGLDRPMFVEVLHADSTARLHEMSLCDAQRAGAFGVPTFVVDDGELFWGQDRLPLLRQHLLGRRARN